MNVEEPATFGLEELSARSGVPARTIRYYQSERLLPIPAKRGRDAVYTVDHLERLRLIGELRDRSLNLASIRDLVANDQPGAHGAEWLGRRRDAVGAVVGRPSPHRWTRRSSTAASATAAAGLIGDLQKAGYVDARTGGTWNVPSPTLLDLALQLYDAGIDVEISGHLRDLLRKRLAKAVDETVKLIVDRVGRRLRRRGDARRARAPRSARSGRSRARRRA